MLRFILSKLLTLFVFCSFSFAQPCEMSSITATALPCAGNNFFVSIDIEVTNSSPGFTLAGNGVIYGTYLYSDLPVVVGPFLGDNESVYEFIAWDVENPACQNFTTIEASDCGPICGFSNPQLDLVFCINDDFAFVEFDFDFQGTGAAFDLFYENGSEVGSWLYESLPVTINSFEVSGAEPIVLTICDDNNPDCCETFELDAIDCDPDNCEIFNVNIDPECTGSNFVVHLDFDYTNVASDSFTVMGNSLNYGTFGYNELPITLGPLNGGTNIVWEFVIKDSELPSCLKAAVLGIYNCPPPCAVLSLFADPGICVNDSTYTLAIELEIEGEGDNGFSVFSEMEYFGSFDYEELPLNLPAVQSSGNIDLITVCDNEFNGCCSTYEYLSMQCSGCIISDIDPQPQPCNDQNQFMVLLDFYFFNVGTEGFIVTGNGMQFGPFSYDDVPVLVGPYDGSGNQVLEFVVTDVQNGDCFDALEIGVLGCDDICSLSNLVADPGVCTGNNQYSVTIDFDFENVLGDGFDLYANGEFFDFYNYNQLPLTIEEFPAGGTNHDTITVCDNDNPDCCATVIFEALSCECDISEPTVDYLGCTSDSTFGVLLEFFYENLPGNFVDVFFDGVFIGFYSVNDIPLEINNIPEGDGVGVLTVCANDLGSCCAEVLVELMNCDAPECDIWELFAETGECTSDSTFVLHVDFNYENLPVDSVLIYGNGEFIGQYQATPDFIAINDFPVLGEVTHLLVCAVGAPDCCADYNFETPDCDTTDCGISGLVAVGGDCLTDSTYVLVIEYNGNNIPGDSVTVTVNGISYGNFYAPEDHIVIEHFPWFDGDAAVVTVCSVVFPDCCDSDEYLIPNCPGMNECDIYELDVNFEGCLSDSTYLVAINFLYQNLPGDSVIVWANDVELGTFHINGGHIVTTVPILEPNVTVITVCAVEAPDCCAAVEFETPFCPGDECAIYNLVVNFEGCQSDSTYLVAINFDYANLPGDSVTITANGNNLGVFHVSDGHIVTTIPEYETNHTVLTVCALGDPECCDVYEFETPFCAGDECAIDISFIEIGDCLTDSTFILEIHFQFANLPTDSVDIYADDTFVGTFQINEGQIVIEHFPVLDENITHLHVCANGDPECCDLIEFETPDCEGASACHIFELEAHFEACQSDSTYILVVNFAYNNLPVDSVIITANEGLFIGQFHVQNGHIVIQDFPVVGSNHTVIHVCAVGAPDCCDVYEFDTPVCDGSCALFDLFAETGQCTSDSTFVLDVVFDAFNLPVDSVTIHVGNDLIGTYFNHPDYIHIEDFPLYGGGTTTITVCAVGAPDCCDSYTFENPNCSGECDIYEMVVDVGDCNSDTTFGLHINFLWVNVSGGFDVYAGDTYMGYFNFDQVPIYIPNFPANSTGNYVVTVCESDNFECCQSLEFEGPVCGQGFCEIFNIEWSITECNDEGNFFFIINFDFENVGNEGFNVQGNGNNYGSFSYEGLPIELGPFENGDTEWEFVITDNQFSDCQGVVVPGVVDCSVANEEINHESIFRVYNNGTEPRILGLKDVQLSIYHSNGKRIVNDFILTQGNIYEMTALPNGMFIGTIIYEDHVWPVKLIKNKY